MCSDELYDVPDMQTETAVHERKPSNVSNESDDSCKDNTLRDKVGTIGITGNWSCNAGDSGIVQKDSVASMKWTVQDQNLSSNAKGGNVPQKDSCPGVENCDFEFKVLPPTG